MRIASHSAHISVKVFDLDADFFEILIALFLIIRYLSEGIFDFGLESRGQFLQLVDIVLHVLQLLLVS